MYWLTRSVITSQADDHDDDGDEGGEQHEPHRDAVDAEVVVHVEALDPGQVLLTNCIAAVPVSKPVISGIVTRKLSERADQRDPAHRRRRCSSRPSASSSTPQTIGSQMARLSKTHVLVLRAAGSAADQARQVGPQLPGQQAEDADDHDQRVPVEVAGLEQAHRRAAMPPTARAEPLITTPSIRPTSPPFHRPVPSMRAPPAQARSR